jgi:nitric oxide reductase subunit B
VLNHGYGHARGPEFLNETIVRTIEWVRMPADLIFAGLGVVPIVIAAGLTYRLVKQQSA